MKVFNVVGARPNFIKIAPLMAEMAARRAFCPVLIHTGQHYDQKMSAIFFEELRLPKPDIDLGVGSGSHAEQTAGVMVAFEKLCAAQHPDLVLVVGDVNSTLACSLVAAKLGLPLAHVEAGLRSRDRAMPEEINRLVTDTLADYLFTTSRDADDNLKAEGIAAEKIFFVGNVMIDTLLKHLTKAKERTKLARQQLGIHQHQDYAVLTLHRPANVDSPSCLAQLLKAIAFIQTRLPIIFPVHPRTRKQLEQLGFTPKLAALPNLITCEPLGYLDFLALLQQAKLVLTDSGGLQEETTVLGVPCLTLRENTERPVTVSQGTNTLVGMDTAKIIAAAQEIMHNGGKAGRIPDHWDGKAAQRIIDILERKLS